ncbi:LysM peptidoglycan-binding domain-containing protein [Clostridium estertheticum]|uniref:LysM peptidoglycan-binding domain-containing protein n=1 Tax=Clostridium estertheticum TaxID=238834 RepID=UPI001CF1B9B8|nr:LysM domain-containing protein [Clostridium estertheticum]MCB2306466.1 LysM peptidoglycan-binding domain-containing protein [Clostridium estertheticum]MCB2344842.1 LysM peptidoglycan-binding domain-containing protein [Clostridium estertheticum]MCB2349765.1 LysM peptidoglycan-binding domain-containing protein [Clostridium estertheticum]WAG46920.1 LysM peptidoglycan-binding domain-containing protein [Clostridium estertheticum]
MRMKKGIISISTVAVLILVVFLAVKYVGGREHVAKVKAADATVAQNDNSTSVVNTDKTTNENTIETDTNKMDLAYINDKTNVGIYTVKKNDTVFSIAKTYMPSQDKSKIVEFIRNRNSMGESYKISEGQKIVIPYEIKADSSKADAAKSDTSKSNTSKAVVAEGNTTEYVVKKQDTLTSIAKNNMPSYSVKKAIGMLKETNKIVDENAIKDGTHIYIPK